MPSPLACVPWRCEASAAANLEGSTAALQALAELGVRIALDDFGTGHFALTYLARLPISGYLARLGSRR